MIAKDQIIMIIIKIIMDMNLLNKNVIILLILLVKILIILEIFLKIQTK